MLGHKQPLGNSMLGHKQPLGKGMLGHSKPLVESASSMPQQMEMEQPKKSALERRIPRQKGMNLGILNA